MTKVKLDRSIPIQIRMSPEEHEWLIAQAEAKKMSISVYVRDLIRRIHEGKVNGEKK